MMLLRRAPALLAALLMLLVIGFKITDDGGVSQDSFAVLLFLIIGIFVLVVITSPDVEIVSNNSSANTINNDSSGSEINKSVLPDPLDEGFDSPLM
ncbi:MAG: hypothetical protein CMO20_04525 [Thermoplasmata archaeon]|nr:hypothetical protein [Thermoplasmata archaeon]